MADTFTQIHIHAVFAVQNRTSLIDKSWKDRLYKYITSIVQNHDHKLLAIGGTTDHVHILIGLRPSQALSELMQLVKRNSSIWINEQRLVAGRFSWQEGYGAFSYSKSHVEQVAGYIEKQEEHHRKRPFSEEYKKMLDDFGLEYDERFVLREIEQ